MPDDAIVARLDLGTLHIPEGMEEEVMVVVEEECPPFQRVRCYGTH